MEKKKINLGFDSVQSHSNFVENQEYWHIVLDSAIEAAADLDINIEEVEIGIVDFLEKDNLGAQKGNVLVLNNRLSDMHIGYGIETISHELRHVWQEQNGWTFDYSIPYEERLHEQDAFEYGNNFALNKFKSSGVPKINGLDTDGDLTVSNTTTLLGGEKTMNNLNKITGENNMKGGVNMNRTNTTGATNTTRGDVNMLNVAITNLEVAIEAARFSGVVADKVDLAEAILFAVSVGKGNLGMVQAVAHDLEKETILIEAAKEAAVVKVQMEAMKVQMDKVARIAEATAKKGVPTPKAPQNSGVKAPKFQAPKTVEVVTTMTGAKYDKEATAMVSSAYVISKLKKLIAKNSYVSHLAIELNNDVYTGKSEAVIGYSSAPLSRIYTAKGLPIEDTITVPAGRNGSKTITKDSFAPFVKHIVSISFKSTDDINTAATDKVAIHWNGKDTKAFLPAINGWKDIITEEFVAELPEDSNVFSTVSYSASGVRTIECLLLDVTNGDNRDEYLNAGSDGAWSELDGKKMSKLAVMKTMPRFGQLQAGSINFGAMPNWTYYKKPFIGSAGEIYDGTVYVLDEYIAEVFSGKLGVSVAPKAVRGMFLQIRPASLKCAALVVDRKFMTTLKAGLDQDFVKDFGLNAGECPVMITDSLSVKLDFNFDVMPDFHLLDMAQSSTAHTSKQMLEKALAIDPTATKELIVELASTQIIGRITKEIFERKASIPTPGQIDKGYISDIVLSLAPEYVLKNKSMFRNVVDNLIQGLVNNLDKMKFEVAGTNARLTSDPCELLGLDRVIMYGEAYLPHAAKHMKKNGLDKMQVAMFKYPTMGIKEYYLFNALTFDTIKERINAMDAPSSLKKIAINMYASLHDGVGILPAVKEIMNQCAGLDYDYDGATFVYDTMLTSILGKVEEEIVEIDPEVAQVKVDKDIKSIVAAIKSKKTEDWVFNKEAIGKAFVALTVNDNKSVGFITNVNTTQIALSMLGRVGRFDEAVDAIKKAFKTTGGLGVYTGLVPTKITVDGITRDSYVVFTDKIGELIEEIKQSDLDNMKNVEKIYADLNRIYRAYQEKTIDAAKKAYNVEIKAIIDHLKAESLLSLGYELDIEEKEFKITRAKNMSKKTTTFTDLMAMIQNHVAKVLVAAVDELLSTEVSMSIEEAARLEGYKTANNKGLIADLINTVKYSYGAIVGEYSTKRKEAIAIDSSMLLDMAKTEFESRVATLSNLVRKMTTNMSSVDRASILMLVSSMEKGGTIKKSSTNQMAINLAKEEFLSMILAHYAEVKVCGYKVLVDKGLEVGTTCDFTFGQASNGSILDFKGEEHSTGSFEIIEFEGAKYAVQPIVIDVPEVKETAAFAIKKSLNGLSFADVAKALESGKKIAVTSDLLLMIDDMAVAEVKSEVYGSGISALVAGSTGEVSNVILCQGNRDTLVVEMSNVEIVESIEEDFEIAGVDGDTIAMVENGADITMPEDDEVAAPSCDEYEDIALVEDLF